MKRISIFLSGVLIFLTACGSRGNASSSTPTSLPTPVSGALVVDPGKDLGPISPYVYGSNFGPWTAVPMGMMEAALDSHVSVLRFPGGNWGDQNDLVDYQIDTFMAFCKQVGAIATISVRLLNGTPEAAANLVRYVNIEKKYGVIYWSIGNEPDLFEGRPGVEYDTARFNQEWRAFARAMKAVDPKIKLLGPELSGIFTANFSTNPKDTSGRDWMTEFLKANGDLVDIVTYHRYPFPRTMTGPNATIDDLRQDSPEWPETVRYLRSLVHEITGRDLPIAVTEAGSHYTGVRGGEATPDSFYNAIWWADVLGRLIGENVFMVNQWLLTTSSSQSDGLGLIAISKVRPTYFVYQMYAHYGTERVYSSSGVKDVSVYAARAKNGSLTIMLINLSDSEKQVPLKIQGRSGRKAEVWLFDATHNAQDIGLQVIGADGILTLPSQSISLYIFQK